jgi:cyanophycin synthetase
MTRLDLAPGAYDEISSARIPGCVDALTQSIPALTTHACSLGYPGGFITRLREGTYAPHIIEHVAIALQNAIGHDVAHGKTRRGNAEGEYTIVFEHEHAGAGLRAAALAVDLVAHAFAGGPVPAMSALTELRAIATLPNDPLPDRAVRVGITGGTLRSETREELIRRGPFPDADLVDVSPGYLLNAGLPYAHSDLAIILDATPGDVSARYRDPERARTLVSVLADAIPEEAPVVCPADDAALHRYLLDHGHQLALCLATGRPLKAHREMANAIAWLEADQIAIERSGIRTVAYLDPRSPALPQLAAALAVALLGSDVSTGHG